MNKIPDLLPGDIILTRSKSWLSKAIRWFGKRQTGDCRFSHSALSIDEMMKVGEDQLIEALTKVKINPVSKYEGKEIIIYRHKHLHMIDRMRVASWALTTNSDQYAWFKIPLFALDSLFKTYKFTRYFGVTNFKVCSNLIGWSYENALKIKFGVDWKSLSPDGIDDFCSKSDDWEIIYSSL